jgi:hypothetical protein
LHLIHQPKDSWTFQLDLRSYSQWRPRVAPKKKP